MRRLILGATLGATLAAVACGGTRATPATPSPTGDAPSYRATLRWTSHGVPHVHATDAGGLGFGQGYAMARSHVCVMADQYVRVRGERARWFGAGAGDANVNSDFANLHLGWHTRAEKMLAEVGAERRAMIEGFAAGYNLFLARTPSSNLPKPCRGGGWVQPVTGADVLAVILSTSALASSRFLETQIATAKPGAKVGALPGRRDVAAASNAWALGADRTTSGGGLLVANPHFPWEGDLVFFESQLTSGDLDVYGVTLVGVPGIQIGMTAHHAWSHTFSSSTHMAIYRLALDGASALRYRHGDDTLPIIPATYTIDVRKPDGSLEPQKRTLYRSAVGPMIASEVTPWEGPGGHAFTVRDVGIVGAAQLDEPLAMARATTRADFEKALALSGTPFVNTIYADATGDALYVDGSRVPALSEQALGMWRLARVAVPAVDAAWKRGVLVLDGSNPTFDLESFDPVAPGAIPIADAPRVARRDFVMNANDRYRFTNPAAPETAAEFSPLYGDDATRPSPRTLANLALLAEGDRAAGDDGRFTLDEAAAAMLSNRSFTGERLRPDIDAACAGSRSAACKVLKAWDGRFALDSRGAALWRELMTNLAVDGTVPWKQAFDRQAPVHTPSGLARTNAELLKAIDTAADHLRTTGVAIDDPLEKTQRAPRGTATVAIPGGDDLDGVANVVGHRDFNFSLLPTTPGNLVNYGSSFILAAELTPGGPHAKALLTYGNTSDPDSPTYRDQLEDFARGELRAVRFTEADILADPALVTEEISSP
jgi:acyl-homoserine-lactone acylase